ncbi:hypothetical protein HPB51_017962 [Rhipicephalus microplus]|uniref:Calcium-activated chloride channel N-terminal domain-containing protein n=1 Tax=Rhipicephalus microplus TaxID=6941 RepID=A0A9J6EPN1_RHIMP|nr:hypothetical protein HPB51_017962 [Rhipicephalus microplus]
MGLRGFATFCLAFAMTTCSADDVPQTASQVHLLVAIHRNVSEQDFSLENLQRFFTRVSRELREVTGRTWIDSVTLQVPSTWRYRRYYEELDADFYQVAQVRVVPSDENTKPRMELVQPLPCGMPGEMILIPESAIMQQSQDRHVRTESGTLAPEHEFVHLWPRFRYGIFDEIGIPGSRRFPMAVTDNDTVFPVSLSKGLTGVLSLPDGSRCAATPLGMVRPDCHLFLQLNNRQTLMDLLRMPYAAANNPTAARYLPTQHNVLCHRQSTSEIIYFPRRLYTEARAEALAQRASFPVREAQGERHCTCRPPAGRLGRNVSRKLDETGAPFRVTLYPVSDAGRYAACAGCARRRRGTRPRQPDESWSLVREGP